METQRIDVALTERSMTTSREKAQVLINAGLVTVNGAIALKPSQKVSAEDVLAVTGEIHPFVGRGGLKLQKALESFNVNPEGRVCADIGASTGGFTDVLLRSGAKKVYAVDVGINQLDASLRDDPRVICMEKTNARTLTADAFSEKPDLIVMDVSFISVRLILPALCDILNGNGEIISLIKPQFEAGRAAIGKNGIVSHKADHLRVLREIAGFMPTLGWSVQSFIPSPITGGDGNKEFLAHFVSHPVALRREAIETLFKGSSNK